MGLDLTAASDILKEDYQDSVSDLLNNKIHLLSVIEENTEDFQGKRAYLPLRIGGNEGIGARDEGGSLPTHGQQEYDAATWNMTYNYGRIKVTGPVIAAARSDEGAFIRAIESEVQGMARDLKKDMNRQLFGNGTGLLANVTGSTGTGGLTITDLDSTKFLRRNMVIDLLESNGADPGNGNGRLVTAVNRSTGVVTVDTNSHQGGDSGNLTYGGNEGVYRAGSYHNELFGLDAIVDDGNPTIGNYGNIDRTSVEEWQATVLENGGTNRALSLDLMQQMLDEIDINGDGNTNLIMCNHALNRKYANLVIPDRRFPTANGTTIELDGGYKALHYDDIPIVKDKDAPDNVMFFLDTTTFMYFKLADWQWMDKDGSVLSRVSGEDAYEAVMFTYSQLGNMDPANNGRLGDLSQ